MKGFDENGCGCLCCLIKTHFREEYSASTLGEGAARGGSSGEDGSDIECH